MTPKTRLRPLSAPLQVGKRYMTRSGHVTEPLHHASERLYKRPFYEKRTTWCWTHGGKYGSGSKDFRDLIAEVVES